MSGAGTGEEREALAGEYVLGTLDARAAAAVERAMATDPALRAAVDAWEARLAPLAALAPPEAPPPGLWERIEAALPGPAPAAPAAERPASPAAERPASPAAERPASPAAERPASPAAPRRAASSAAWWRGWAIGASAVAAGLAALLVLRPAPEPPRMMTVLLTARDQPAWLVEAERDGAIRLAALNPQQVPSGRVLQLWALPQGATAPTSLGLIPPAGRVSVTPAGIRPEPGMLIEISLEPEGGSPTGRPTGPILFIGRLAAAGGA